MTSHPPRRLLLLSALAAAVGLAAGGPAWVLDPRHRRPDQRGARSTAGGAACPTSATSRSAGRRAGGDGRRHSGHAPGPLVADHPRSRHPRGDGGRAARRSRVAPRTAVAKPLSAAIAIGTGGPFGAEGPIIVTGGAIGSLVGQVLHVSASERKILLACGAAAGMAATFGTPLAAVVLAIELLLFEFSPRALHPPRRGDQRGRRRPRRPVRQRAPVRRARPRVQRAAASCRCSPSSASAAGCSPSVISRGLFAVEGLFRRLPVGEAWHPIVGAAIWASLGLLVPRALGVGYDVIERRPRRPPGPRHARRPRRRQARDLVDRPRLGHLRRHPGADPAHQLVLRRAGRRAAGPGRSPGLGVSPSAFALVAMAATFGAAARAPFAAIIFLFELDRGTTTRSSR